MPFHIDKILKLKVEPNETHVSLRILEEVEKATGRRFAGVEYKEVPAKITKGEYRNPRIRWFHVMKALNIYDK